MVNLYYNFTSIHLDQFAILNESMAMGPEMGLSNTLSFWFDEKRNQLFCRFGITVSVPADTQLVKAEISCGFEISEDTLKALSKKDNIVFPVEMLGHVASLSYSTLRGVVFSRLEGTSLQNLVLPLQNIYPNITQPFSFKKKS